MAKNLINFSSPSSSTNESTDVRQLLSPTEYSNLDLNPNFHRIKTEQTTYVSPHRIRVHSVIDYIPTPPGFPPKETTTVNKVVETSHLLTPTSTMGRVLGSTSRSAIQPQVPCVINQPTMQYHEALKFLNQANLQNMVKEEPNSHESNPSRINQGHSLFDQTAMVLRNLDNNVHRNVKKEPVLNESPSYNNQGLGDFDQQGVVLGNHDDPNNSNATAQQVENQPGSDPSSKVDSDDEDGDDPIPYDGRIHSLPRGPDGVYACPNCQVTCESSQSFAAHIRSHYRVESEKAKNIRISARYQRRYFRRQRSRYGINTVRRNNGIAVNVENGRMGFGLTNTPVEAGPSRRGVIKEEPIYID